MSAAAARAEARQQLAEARACLVQGRLAVAFASYDELLRRGNESGDAWLVARAYAGRGEIKLAQGWLSAREPHLDIEPGEPLASGELPGALEDLQARTANAEQVREIERLYERAEQRLRGALAAEPGYAWAKRFLAYVLTMRGSFEAAAALSDELSAAAGREDAPSACMMSLLCRYAAAQKGEAQGEERERLLLRALAASMVAAQDNHEDFMAVYAHAASCVDAGLDDAPGVVRGACARILDLAARAVFIAFVLHRSVGQDERSFLAIFDQTMRTAHLDVETLGIAQRDPAWQHQPSELVRSFEERPLLRRHDSGATLERLEGAGMFSDGPNNRARSSASCWRRRRNSRKATRWRSVPGRAASRSVLPAPIRCPMSSTTTRIPRRTSTRETEPFGDAPPARRHRIVVRGPMPQKVTSDIESA